MSFYGQSGNQPAAVAQATDILAACTASQAPFIVAGDFNLEPTEAVLGEALAVGAIRSLDDAAQGAPLPATGPGRKRRIDHGVCHWSLAASRVDCFDVPFSDHASVAYDVPLDAPAFLSMPKRSPPTDASPEDVQQLFEAADLSAFWSAIETADVDTAWQALSDIAEQCLCTPAADPNPRSHIWTPALACTGSSRRLEGSAAVRALNKLTRRLETIAQRPDEALKRKILNSLPRARSLVPGLPWVSETGLLDLLGPVTSLLYEHRRQEAAAIRARWRQLLRDDTARQRAFVKARADAQLEFEKQPTEQAARDAGPVHPSPVVRAQATEWLKKWKHEPSPNLSAIDRVLEGVTPIPQVVLDVHFDPERSGPLLLLCPTKPPARTAGKHGTLQGCHAAGGTRFQFCGNMSGTTALCPGSGVMQRSL